MAVAGHLRTLVAPLLCMTDVYITLVPFKGIRTCEASQGWFSCFRPFGKGQELKLQRCRLFGKESEANVERSEDWEAPQGRRVSALAFVLSTSSNI